MFEQDLIDINTKFDAKIADLQYKLTDLQTRKESLRNKVKAYYSALDKKVEVDAIISKGKPIV